MGPDPGHAAFQNRLRKSEVARWYVARWLSCLGFSAWVPPIQVAPTAKQWQEYADNGDIYMGLRLEVKHRPDIHFTCAQDFPFPTFIVCARNPFDRAHPKPWCHIILNDTKSHAGIVYSDSHKTWLVERLTSKDTGQMQDYYLAPLSVVAFVPVDFNLRVDFTQSQKKGELSNAVI